MNGKHILLHKDLSYQLQGSAMEVRRNFGPGHKEKIYQNAFAEELKSRDIVFEQEKNIAIYSPKTGKAIGFYRPDFIVDNRIIVELKAVEKIPRIFLDQLYDYLRNSEYELGYFINFSSPKLYIKRIIFTNDRKYWNLKKLLVILSFLFVSFSVSQSVEAAEFFFGVRRPAAARGEIFETGVFINTVGGPPAAPAAESVNAVEGEVVFPSDRLRLVDIRDGNSLINLWLEHPSLKTRNDTKKTLNNTNINTKDVLNDMVAFSGIIPGGYAGSRGYLFSLIFEALKPGRAVVAMRNEKALLNDGVGSPMALASAPLNLTIAAAGAAEPYFPPYDQDPPESFLPQIGRDPLLFEGRAFIAFSANDKLSGIDHYELREKKWLWGENDTLWRTVTSPHPLADQRLLRPVLIKAVDRAGNERIASVSPPRPWGWYNDYPVFGILMMLVIGAALWLLTPSSKFRNGG